MKNTLQGIAMAISLALFCPDFSHAQDLNINQPDSVFKAKIAEPVPYFKFMAVEDKNLLLFEPSDLCGKVAILEIWATDCKSSQSTIKHHEALKQQFKDNLEIIFITEESLSTLTKYVGTKKTSVFFALDAEKNLSKIFPHATKPHSIVIDKDGYVRAITYPEEITPQFISKLLNNEHVAVRLKSELLSGQDVSFGNNKVAEPIYKSIISTYDHNKKVEYEWLSDNEFRFVNFSLPAIYQSMYKYPPVRVIVESNKVDFYNKDHNSFVCFDMKIPSLSKPEIIKEAIQQLNKALPLKSKIDYRTRVGYSLIRDTGSSLFSMTSNDDFIFTKNELIGTHLKSNGLAVRTLGGFIDLIEMYGLVDAPIVNNTGFPSNLPISIEGLPSTPNLLNEALLKYGLKLIAKEFTTEYLILYDTNDAQFTLK
jgi:thiol-disulfide isomerase/thioredoxin